MDSLLGFLRFIFICLEVLLIFNVLILVHELGHFWAARWRGLYVEAFGIWFGKPIWRKKINGVWWQLGSIPAGGFVKLPQLAPMESLEGVTEIPREQLKPISALDKIIVAAAGPVFSLGLAFVFALVVWQVGRPVSEAEGTTRVGFVLPGSPATGVLEPGDEIVAIDGHPVRRWMGQAHDSIVWRIVRSEGETLRVDYRRGGETRTAEIKPVLPETEFWQRRAMRQLMIMPAETPVLAKVAPGSPAEKAGLRAGDAIVAVNGKAVYSDFDLGGDGKASELVWQVERGKESMEVRLPAAGPVVRGVFPGGPAERAGLKPGDRLVAMDGEPVTSTEAAIAKVSGAGDRALVLGVERGGERLELKAAPQVPVGGDKPKLGIEFDPGYGIVLDTFGRFKIVKPGPFEQIRQGVMQIFSTIEAIASNRSSVKIQHVGGPLQMMRLYYMLFESPAGWQLALWWSVVLNVNLALINLLPIPVLDGGHILIATVEAVRRRPLNYRFLETVNTACAMLVIGFMIFITFFDVQDFFGRKRPAMQFADPPAQQP